jgi:hypothetical protein
MVVLALAQKVEVPERIPPRGNALIATGSNTVPVPQVLVTAYEISA